MNKADRTVDGFEGIWQVNFLSHFLLVQVSLRWFCVSSRFAPTHRVSFEQLLLPLLEQCKPSRVVHVSSQVECLMLSTSPALTVLS